MPLPYASYSQILSPSSPSHAVTARLTRSTTSSSYPSSRGVLHSHLVTARDDTLQVWEVRVGQDGTSRLWHLKSTTFFGSITGLQATRTIESDKDGLDRILLSFKDAKIALLEWSELDATFETVSIHTYERTTQMVRTMVLQFLLFQTGASDSLPPFHRYRRLMVYRSTSITSSP